MRLAKKAAMVLFVFFCSAFMLTATARAQEPAVRITQIKGSVQVKNGAGTFSVAKPGQMIGMGYTVKTGAGGSCILNWSSGHAVKVIPMSIVSVDTLESTGARENNRVSIQSGKMYARVAKLSGGDSKFEIKTPTAVAAVRGSEIIVEATEQASSFQVIDGSFEVSAESVAYIVDENFQMDVTLNVAPEAPDPIPPDQLEELHQEVQEFRMEINASDTEIQNMGSDSEKTGPEESTGKTGATTSGADSEETAKSETGDDSGPLADQGSGQPMPESVDALIEEISNVVNQDTVIDPLVDSAQTFEPGTGWLDITID